MQSVNGQDNSSNTLVQVNGSLEGISTINNYFWQHKIYKLKKKKKDNPLKL